MAAAALAFSAFSTVGFVYADAAQTGYDPAGMAINAAFGFAIGFPLAWALLKAEIRITGWWQERHPLRAAPTHAPGEETPSFRWAGRSVRQPWGIVAFTAFTILLLVAVLLDQPPGTAMGNLTLALGILFLIICAAAVAFALRRKSYLIDASGVHVERGMRSDLHLRWNEIKEIGIVQFPLANWFPPIGARGAPRMIWFRKQDGAAAGLLQPEGEVPREVAGPLEAALRAQATAHGVPVRELGYREIMTWRRPKRRLSPGAAP